MELTLNRKGGLEVTGKVTTSQQQTQSTAKKVSAGTKQNEDTQDKWETIVSQ